jgi:hypothetical protein
MQTIGAIALSAAMAMVSTTALAHGPHGNYPGSAGQGYGPMMQQGCGGMSGGDHGRMMGHMMGQGQMGQGQGPMMGQDGMMGQGQMGQGQGLMMGQGGMMGQGQMGQGQGPMMGQGGMMGQGQMGQGQGPMMGQGGMMGQGAFAPLAEDLSVAGVTHIMEHQVAMRQNPNLKVGEVTEVDDDTITADVVTQDGSLVRRYMVDRHTGAMRPADMPANQEQ